MSNEMNISRRSALKQLAALMGGTALVASGAVSLNTVMPGEALAATTRPSNTEIKNTLAKISKLSTGTQVPAHRMNDKELAYAKEVFKQLNNLRRAAGQKEFTWDKNYLNVAYWSAAGCSYKGTLTHRLGIPGAIQDHVSDILMYSTWQMKPFEAISRWANSSGHNKMMQCETSAGNAAVGVFVNASGTVYLTIAYNFKGHNQNPNPKTPAQLEANGFTDLYGSRFTKVK